MICKCIWFYIMICFTATVAQDYDGFPEETEKMYCFQCNSQQDPDCRNVQSNDTSSWAYKPCLDTDKYGGRAPFCRKIVQTIFPRENMQVVIRKCGWVPHPNSKDCYNVRNEDHVETICQCFSAGCNSATGLVASLALVTFTAFAGYTSLVW